MYTYEDLVAGSVTPLVLAVLSEGESYGFVVLDRVRELSGGELGWSDAMVYPLFHRLHRLGYLATEWRTMPDGRRRRYYALTDDGHAVLARLQRPWVGALLALHRLGSGSWRLLAALSPVSAAGPTVTVVPRRDLRVVAR